MTEPASILVVDDERGLRDLLSREFGDLGYRVESAADGHQALERIRAARFDLMISDVRMPGLSGIELLKAAKTEVPEMEVLLTTGYANVEMAVEAMKEGAFDFVQKPVDLPQLCAHVERALERRNLKVLNAVYEASRAVFRSVRLDDILPALADISRRLLRADTSSVMLHEDGKLRVAACSGTCSLESRRAVLDLGERVAGRVAQSRAGILIQGPLSKDPRFADVPVHKEVDSSALQPLVAGGELLGLISVSRAKPGRPLDESDLRILAVFAGQAAQAVLNARTYRKLESAQAELIRSEKLKAVGLLAAGVAHEINNPLTAILTTAQLLMDSKPLSGQQSEDLETIRKQTLRCSRIVQDLLRFGRERPPEKTPQSLSEVMDSTLALLKRQISSSGAEVATRWPESEPKVLADRGQLQQVFLNLVTNALHAVEGREKPVLSLSVEPADGGVRVRIEDSGAGIPESDLERVFDPFFTTKPMGKGTGLGMSVCSGIVSEHGGEIRIKSREGGPTVVTVELPAAPAPVPAGS